MAADGPDLKRKREDGYGSVDDDTLFTSFSEHFEALSQHLNQRWEKNEYCDLSLLATASKETVEAFELKKMPQVIFHKGGTVEVHMHQLIAAQAPQLHTLMEDKKKQLLKKGNTGESSNSNHNNVPSQSLQLSLTSNYVEAGALVRCVKFMYNGSLDVSSSTVTDLLRTSHYLGLETAKRHCINYMLKSLSPSNALSRMAIGNMSNCGELLEKGDQFFCNHFTAVSQGEEWKDLQNTAVVSTLRRNELVCRSEMDIIMAVYIWGTAPFEQKSMASEGESVELRLKEVAQWMDPELGLIRSSHLSDEELESVRSGGYMDQVVVAKHKKAHEQLLAAGKSMVEYEYRHRNDRAYTRDIPELRQYEYDRGRKITRESCESTLRGHDNYVYTVCEVGCGVLASGSRDHSIIIWNTKTKDKDMQIIKVLDDHNDRVFKVQMFRNSKHEKLLLSCSWDNTARVWDPVNDFACIGVLNGHTNWVVSSTIWQNKIVTGSADKEIKIWNIDTFQNERTLTGHVDHVYALCVVNTLDRNERPVVYLASGSQDNTLKIWDSKTWSCIHTLEGHKDQVRCVVQYKDKLISGSSDKMIRLWDTRTWRCVEMLAGHTGVIECLCVLDEPQVSYLVSASRDDTIMLWDVEAKECVKTLRGHRHWVKGLQVTSDGKLASASADNSVKIWNYRV